MLRNFLALFLLLFYCNANTQGIGSIEKTDCFLNDCTFLEKSPGVEFGYITVPEDYTKPNGNLLKIAFAIIKARVPEPKRDAVIIFQGGWGTKLLDDLRGYIDHYPVKDRDLILYDYRGIGYSEPKMCQWLGATVWNGVSANITNTEFIQHMTAQFNLCLDTLIARNIDFNQFGSNNKTKDAVLLAEKLGYESYDCFGISYGTRAIQNFIRATDSTNVKVRAAILDSNCPMGFSMQGNLNYTYAASLDHVLNDCAQNTACNSKFPNLKGRFFDFLNTLKKDPLIVINGESQVALNREEVNGIMHQILYDRSNYKDIPLLLEHFIDRDAIALQNILPLMQRIIIANFSAVGLNNYVYDWKAFQNQATQEYLTSLKTLSDYNLTDPYIDFYMKDIRFRLDSLEAIPIKSAVPALILAGEYDPITPPEWSQRVRASFENNYYFEFKKYGHGVAPTEAGEQLFTSFLNDPTKEPISTDFVALGENDIAFTTAYYKNNLLSGFLLDLFENQNWVLIVGLLFVIIVGLINTVIGLIYVFKKSNTKKIWITSTSFLILLFLCGLFYFMFTSKNDGMLIMFGMPAMANYFLFLLPFILIFAVVAISKYFKKENRNLWNTLSILSFVLFFLFIAAYRLVPHF
jgi:pimeloyl-ACP methyl ester carboxylesterase